MIMLETDSDVFVGYIIKSYMKEHNRIDKQTEGSRLSFKFVCSFSIRCDKVNEPNDSSTSQLNDWGKCYNLYAQSVCFCAYLAP